MTTLPRDSQQLYLFPVPGQTLKVKRAYIRHKQQHVLFLEKNYAYYTLKELEQLLGLPWQKIKKLAERHGIRKRAPNMKKVHNAPLAVAA